LLGMVSGWICPVAIGIFFTPLTVMVSTVPLMSPYPKGGFWLTMCRGWLGVGLAFAVVCCCCGSVGYWWCCALVTL
jgi:hypothetical protein